MKRLDVPLLAAPQPQHRGRSLPATALRTLCDPAQFDFDSTRTLAPPREAFGQSRARDAVALALDLGAWAAEERACAVACKPARLGAADAMYSMYIRRA